MFMSVCIIVHDCQLSYTTQHKTVLIIFPLNLQTNVITHMLSIGAEGRVLYTALLIEQLPCRTALITRYDE